MCLALIASQIDGCANQGPRPRATDPLVPSTVPTVSAAAQTLVTFDAGEFSIDYPSNWHAYRVTFPIGTLGSTVGLFGTADLRACEAQDDWRCVNNSNLGPGEVLLRVGTQVGAGPFADLEPPGGFTVSIDGMPAVATSITTDLPNGADGERVWMIEAPGRLDAWYTVSAVFREPGADRLASVTDSVARSVRFHASARPVPTDAAGTSFPSTGPG